MHEMNAYRIDHVCLSVSPFTYFNSRTARRILIIFGMDVMSLEATALS
jgi:hypothetical protein